VRWESKPCGLSANPGLKPLECFITWKPFSAKRQEGRKAVIAETITRRHFCATCLYDNCLSFKVCAYSFFVLFVSL
jgi:hypothetical protein